MAIFDLVCHLTTFQNFIRPNSPYYQYLHMEHDKEEKEEFLRSSTQSDHDKQGNPNDPGYMSSSTSTHEIQSGSSEKETGIAQDMDKSSVLSVSSPLSPSDSAYSSLQFQSTVSKEEDLKNEVESLKLKEKENNQREELTIDDVKIEDYTRYAVNDYKSLKKCSEKETGIAQDMDKSSVLSVSSPLSPSDSAYSSLQFQSTVSKEEDLKNEVESLKLKEKENNQREELTIDDVKIEDYTRYAVNDYKSLKKWSELAQTILKYILSVFFASQSKSEIEEHKREIILCVECLRWFAGHDIAGRSICLPIPDLNNLIDTFIDHLSRVEDVLEEAVYDEYCSICADYSFKVKDRKDYFLPKILSTFRHILEGGSKKKLSDNIVLNLLKTLRNISTSTSTSTRSSILTLIKPYVKDWLRMYNDSQCYGHWMIILSKITLLSDTSPNSSLCSEAWPLFHPVLDVVKREFVGDRIVGYDHEECLRFFSSLCCDPSHALVIYDNVKDLLDGWFEVVKRNEHKWGSIYWPRLISMFSTVPSLVPQLSPKYDTNMDWCKKNGRSPKFDAIWCTVEWYYSTPIYNQYISNISSFVSSSCLFSILFHSVPMVSFIPSIETSLSTEKDGYSYASHVCSIVEMHKHFPHRKNKISCYHDIISGKEIQIQHVLKRDGSSSQDILTHSSLIQYTPPQHMLVKIPLDDERFLRQSVYNLIERTGGGVEVMFEQECRNIREFKNAG
ncbi:hypothetical protein ADUPG1_012708 [Aduncisulcus paluster]|uniref:Uncharacterized protein n=1 Tax=Aduncisulcus paluster TaxID=2918883 RepID=A0ABQ5K0D6_9EUKA|nr:hypothetical protein ADUPG1_012708 [Aduncisulcus paluster]